MTTTVMTVSSTSNPPPPIPRQWLGFPLDPSPEEVTILDYLRSSQPELVLPFLKRLGDGRRGILLRLLQAAVRENLADSSQSAVWCNAGRTLQIGLSEGRMLRVPVARRLALGRFDVEGQITLHDGETTATVRHPCQLLDLLEVGGHGPDADARIGRFRSELDNSAANLALALAGGDVRRASLRKLAEVLDVSTSLEFVEVMATCDPTFSPLAFYEQWVVEGHPLHPGARMKLGMPVGDVIANAPEWGAQPGVEFVAVPLTACHVASRLPEMSAAVVLYREYPGLREAVVATLTPLGKAPSDHELIPVHPWQRAHTLPVLHAEPIARGEIIPIVGFRAGASALLSVRSMAPVQRRGDRKHHLKTAINVHMTSAVRTVSPNAAENGPALSRVIDQVQAREKTFGGNFVALAEDVGISYRPSDASSLAPETAAAQSRHLGALLRENPENHAGPGEIAMPAAALTAESPLGGRPVVVELIEALALKSGQDNREQAALSFMRQYAAVSVPGFLTFMTRYGIALEGHMQNSVAVFHEGRPVRMLVRDLGAVRVVPERLEQQGIPLALVPGSATLADDLDDLRNKVYYAFFQNHLAELIVAIVRHLGVNEYSLWREVASVTRQVFAGLKVRECSANASGDESALFCPTLALKALTTMRLKGDVTDYTFAEVSNPLTLCEETHEGRPAQ